MSRFVDLTRVLAMIIAILSLVFYYGFPASKSGFGIGGLNGGYALCINLFLGLFLFIFLKLLKPHVLVIKDRRTVWLSKCMAGLFSTFLVVGHRFSLEGSLFPSFSSFFGFGVLIIQIFGFYLLFQQLVAAFYFYINLGGREVVNLTLVFGDMNSPITTFFKKNIFVISFFILWVCWTPYLVSFYPGLLAADPVSQIRQYFGEYTHIASLTNLIDQQTPLTNSHPYFHTYLLGICAQIGKAVGSISFGIFLSSMLQALVLASAFSLSIYYFERRGVPFKYLMGLLFTYALVPVYPFYVMTPIKDALFTGFFVLFTLYLMVLVQAGLVRLPWGFFAIGFVLSMLLALTRHNGIYIILGTWLVYAVCVKFRRQFALCMLGLVGLSFYCYNFVVLPDLKVSPSSLRSSLWVPFQQTARVAKYNPSALSVDDLQAIRGVLSFGGVEEMAYAYNPNRSDPVAYHFRKEATPDQVSAYLKVWALGGLKTPGIYLAALVHKSYGYFYPLEVNWTVYKSPSKMAKKHGLDYQIAKFKDSRNFLIGLQGFVTYAPILSLFHNIGFATWMVFLLTSVWLIRRDSAGLIALVPSLALCLTLFGTPWNGHFRYVFPIVAAVPILLVYTRYFFRRH